MAEAKALRPIIARLMVLTTEKSNSIKLEFTTGNLKMRSASPEHGHGDEPTRLMERPRIRSTSG